jgi:hypothetical protein
MKINCKNILSYPNGSVCKGCDILSFINYHTSHVTGHSKIAHYMKRKFGSINPDMEYKLFHCWIRNIDEFDNERIDKPRLLRIDHSSPVVRQYDFYHEEFYYAKYEGCKEIKVN